MYGKIMEKENLFPTIFPQHFPPGYQRFHKQQLIHKLHPAAKVCWYPLILFFLINKQKGSFLCGEDARHPSASAV